MSDAVEVRFTSMEDQLAMADNQGRLPVICANLRATVSSVVKGAKVYVANPLETGTVQIMARSFSGNLVKLTVEPSLIGDLRLEYVQAMVVARCWRGTSSEMSEMILSLQGRCAPTVLDFSTGIDLAEIAARTLKKGVLPGDT